MKIAIKEDYENQLSAKEANLEDMK